jgi:8-oxo-dGTP pyrophosphatase MutT (NUDIX family)
MTGRNNPWRTLGSRAVYDSPWISVREDAVVSPGGRDARYGVVSFRNTAIGVLPVEDDGHVHLVGQWRYALGAFSWEIPEGGGRKDSDPLDEARRELREETGLEAAHWREILRMHLSNSITDEAAVIFLATGLSHAGEPAREHSEQDMEQARIPFADLLRRVTGGDITDSLTVAAVLRTHQMAVKGELEPGLAEAILKGAR